MRLLIITDPTRPDHFDYLIQNNEHQYFFLWFDKLSSTQTNSHRIPKNIVQIYWQDFRTPRQLIDIIKPDKVVLFDNTDLRIIALIVKCKYLNLPTVFLDHGLLDKKDFIRIFTETTFLKDKLPYFLKRLISGLTGILKAKVFYYSTLIGFTSIKSYYKFFFLPFKMILSTPQKVLSKVYFDERIPSAALIFNLLNLEQYALLNGKTITNITITGYPIFDKYFCSKTEIQPYFVFIDSPYLEEKFVNWTPEHHKKIAQNLFAFAKKRSKKLYVKLHPKSNRKLWQDYQIDNHIVTILQDEDCTDLYLKSELILSYSSTLMIAFICAKKNVVLLGWNPEQRVYGPDFSALNVCHKSLAIEELDKKYDIWLQNNLLNNTQNYLNFIKLYNSPFDGKAASRIINAVLKK